jgi:hypothetical protein
MAWAIRCNAFTVLMYHVRMSVEQLVEVREALDGVHKRLLDATRADWETLRGPIAGPGQFLELLMADPFFAWLRPMSRLMADIDEATDADEPPTPEQVDLFVKRVQELLTHERYLHYLQISADLVIDHAALRRALSKIGV